MNKNESCIVIVLRDFVVYHVIWEHTGRTGVPVRFTVRPDFTIEWSLISQTKKMMGGGEGMF